MIWAKKLFLLLFLGLHPVIIIFFWLQGNRDMLSEGGYFSLYAWGRLAGLLLVYQVLLQMFFIGRIGWAEKLFGLDRLVYAHRWNGFLALIFLFIHPLFLIIGAAHLRGSSFVSQFVMFLNQDDVLKAVLGHLLFVAVIAFTAYAILKKAKYETWYFVHLALYGAILLAFGHQLEIGEDLMGNVAFRYYWIALYTFFVGAFLISRFWNPLVRFLRHRFFLDRIVPECNGVFSFYISGNNIDNLKVSGGQFLMLRFLSPKFIAQSHPFSVSMPPKSGELRVTVKALGDFTAKMKNIPPRTKILIDGPHGIFTASRARKKKLLCIAGGIGITPIRSVTEDALRAGKEVILVFSSKTRNDFAFQNEFAELSNSFGDKLKIFYLASGEVDGWLASLEQGRSGVGETGVLDEEKLYALVPDFAEREIYLCGPIPMVKSVRHILHKAGVRKKFIHFEMFKLL